MPRMRQAKAWVAGREAPPFWGYEDAPGPAASIELPGQGALSGRRGRAGRANRWAASPTLFMAAPATRPGVLRARIRPRKLVSYLGLDPRVRQSGNAAARHGRISKAGASEPRHMLGEVAWKVARAPGPLRAFFERIRARRGPQVAATATARKLVVLFWQLLTREEDYAFQRPSMTRNKIRQLELLAGAPPRKGKAGVAGGKSQKLWDAERELSRQAEASYRRLTADWRATGPAKKVGAGATPGRAHLQGRLCGKPRGRLAEPQTPALCSVSHPHPARLSHR